MARYAFGGSQILHTRSAQIARRANLSQVSRLRRRANQNDLLAHPASMKRDVRAFVTTREAGMRWTRMARQTNVACADGEVAWSRPPDAEVKFGDDALHHAGDGGKKARSPRRSRYKP